MDTNMDRRQMMIAFDMRYGLEMSRRYLRKSFIDTSTVLPDLNVYFVSSMLHRCLGFMMAKMVLQELMDPSVFSKFKSFLTKVSNTKVSI